MLLRSAAKTRRTTTLLLVLLAACPAQALLRFNDGHDQIFVTAFVGAGYDSNIFASSSGDNGSMVISGGASMEYSHKAGLIGVNATLGWDFSSFKQFSSENFLNPAASLEFTKGTGRTTGSLQFNAKQESTPDQSIGQRTESWNYGVNLNYRYPVIERYSIAGNLGWDRVDYSGNGNAAATSLVDLDSYNIGTDLLYSWRSDRSLLAGYRYRISDSSATSQSTDHSYYTGVSGHIISKLSGSARVGWTYRINEYPSGIPDDTSDGLFASISTTWPATRRVSFTLSATQDFGTSATNSQTQTTEIDLSGQFSHTSKFSTNAQVGVGSTDYISSFSSNTGHSTGFNNQERSDNHLTAGFGASYALTSHLGVSANYNYYQDWSSLAGYDSTRHSVNVNLSTRW